MAFRLLGFPEIKSALPLDRRVSVTGEASLGRPERDTQGLRVGHSQARASGPRPRVRYALVPAFRRDDAVKAHDVVECVLAGNDPERAPQRIEALEAGGV